MKTIRSFGVFFARFLISILFLVSAMDKILHWQVQERNLFNLLSDWQSYAAPFEPLQDFFVRVTPWTPLVLIGFCLFELLGGLFIFLGMRERIGAFLLILSLLPMTFLMHPFWLSEGLQREVELSHFLKNLALLGALLMIAMQGVKKEEGRPFLSASSLRV